MTVEFTDNSMEVKTAIDAAVLAFLEEAGAEIEAQAIRNTRVDTGQTKGHWRHIVDDSKGTVTIGNPLQNAIWEEFGTGEYAIKGDGRKSMWTYKHPKKGFVTTKGKKPTRALQKAIDSRKKVISKYAQDKFGAVIK